MAVCLPSRSPPPDRPEAGARVERHVGASAEAPPPHAIPALLCQPERRPERPIILVVPGHALSRRRIARPASGTKVVPLACADQEACELALKRRGRLSAFQPKAP